MKFIHTADWQLGARCMQAGSRAAEVRAIRFDAAEAVVRLAEEEEVDFVLIAGDTFEDHNVDDAVVRKAVRILNRLAPRPVYLLPGNHDPLIPGGVWDRESWKRIGAHVHLLRRRDELEVREGVALYPCPLTQKRSSRDPTRSIPVRDEGDERIRIGLAHGALGILPEGGSNFPIDPERAEACGLDYLALGDWHSIMVASDRVAYSGTIEATGFAEKDPGNVLLVQIGDAGEAPSIQKKAVGCLRWVFREIEIRDETDLEALERDLDEIGEMERLLLRLRIKLVADAERNLPVAFDSLRQELEDSCFLLDVEVDDSAFAVSLEVELPAGVLRRADEALFQIRRGSIPEGPGRSFASEDEDVLAEAQALLHRLAWRADR